ncbi:hypothetical protein AB0E75_01990 [Streptomyces griseoviridis]|uniref:Uncharacterized protein n=1 Tax=Streptomyces griseoviridis TaxID=45398 RepID=A0A918G481_STRGD|nr:hypothetical protein [Streptomyces niveoruber]GGS18234.1 hypothetical protein GCM10010238_02940 [Streptomyces niveoruber]
MAAHLTFPAPSKPSAEHSAETEDAFGGPDAYGEPPLTSEPPLPDAEPLTSESPFPDVVPLTSESSPELTAVIPEQGTASFAVPEPARP